ncbi:MAG TPA: nucleoside hydrolase [Hypericibacter adhaerens]|jgi:purine nucleosidase|uniref:Ribosylpyrimidine nucleosidase n=1 Tax=Hypericibacter adhaerens TaxID=2602016 RepID=A0A5J6MZH3_9PROT|nr:nucleoside hydrolase [Hypericibacter adhaerens]QEX22035.1 ribosylpyrimidine nucleosidase [Hypericibacter adhaerens]HWA46307.1 nucleoside hydrolase [Hypericibacter adhaerens]
MALPIIIDTDPGQDDCIAILLALASPELQVLGLTTVAGNVSAPQTARNALRICALAKRRDLPVFAGCERPLLNQPYHAPEIHGESGLDGAHLPEPRTKLQPRHAVDWLVETLMSRDEPTTIVAVAPLTNIAMALRREPRIADKIKRLVIMGGALRVGGNMTPAAEFNVFVDPHAAAIVFDSDIDIALFPLDVTWKVRVRYEHVERLRAAKGAAAHTVADLMDFYLGTEAMAQSGQDKGAPLHDACAIAWLIDPTLFRGSRLSVRVETGSPLTLGQTLPDWRGLWDRPANVEAFEDADAPRILDLLIQRLGKL